MDGNDALKAWSLGGKSIPQSLAPRGLGRCPFKLHGAPFFDVSVLWNIAVPIPTVKF